MNTLPPIPAAWIFLGLDSFRATTKTYEAFDYEALPPLVTEKLDGSWKWLQEVINDPAAKPKPTSEWPEAILKGREKANELSADFVQSWHIKLQNIQNQAEQRQLLLPASFLAFMQHPEWFRGISSPTDCFFELDEEGFIDLKDRPDECLLHFYSDSQYCLLWYLHFDSVGKSRVVVSSNTDFHMYQYDYEQIKDVYQEEAQAIIDAKESGSHTFLRECAPDFESFIYRIWLECSIWYATSSLYKATPLNAEQQQYVDFYSRQ